MKKYQIGVLVGSLRKNSYSRSVANSIIELLPEDMQGQIIPLDALPIYNQDFDDEGNPPAAWTDFRATCSAVDAVLLVTPEYNRSMPAVIKNALDVGSRPYGKNVFDGKPGAIVSVSPGKTGAFGSNHHLRQSTVFLNIHMLNQPEMYLGEIAGAIDESGKVTAQRTLDFLAHFADEYAAWVRRMA